MKDQLFRVSVEEIRRIKHEKFNPRTHPKMNKLLHFGHEAAHLSYLGFVYIEAHGAYGTAAGILFIFVLLYVVLGLGD